MTNIYPAPWKLRGNGYIFAFRFPRTLQGSRFFSSPFLGEAFSGFGAMMLVDYLESTAGPYRELLFVPGRFPFGDKKYYSITKIFVSTMESVENGRRNWGIPKELADFSITSEGPRRERIAVAVEGKTVIDITMKQGVVPVPVTSSLLPVTLAQKEEDTIYFTQFKGKGTVRPAQILSLTVNHEMFPAVDQFRPFMSLYTRDFSLEFPMAQTMSEEDM
jgi:hypothetical protein